MNVWAEPADYPWSSMTSYEQQLDVAFAGANGVETECKTVGITVSG